MKADSTLATSIPLWMQITSFAVATFLAILKAIEFFRRGTLEVRLTRDSFFRLTDFGESLFVHAVLLDRDGPALIEKVSLTMRRLPTNDGRTAEKLFPLDIIEHGEKVKGQLVKAEHHFYGSSPLLYVGGNTTNRPVYWCVYAEYQRRQQEALAAFDNALFAYKQEYEAAIANESPKPDATLIKELETIVNQHFGIMSGLVQLESGRYELALTVSYQKIGSIVWKPQRTTKSYGYFTVDNAGLQAYKGNDLRNVLNLRAANTVKSLKIDGKYPEYNFKDFTEAREKQN
jgi:hypothetical protein